MQNLAETGVYGQGGLCSPCAPETLKSHDGSLPPSKSCHDHKTHTRVPPWSVLLWGPSRALDLVCIIMGGDRNTPHRAHRLVEDTLVRRVATVSHSEKPLHSL